MMSVAVVLITATSHAHAACSWAQCNQSTPENEPQVDAVSTDAQQRLNDYTSSQTYVDDQARAEEYLASPEYAEKQQQSGVQPADNNDGPCGILICMSASGSSPKECRRGIEKFEKIRKTHNGHFSPSRTKEARRKKLDECEGGSNADKNAIISAWGGQPYIIGAWKFY
jgi:hypothetical protein